MGLARRMLIVVCGLMLVLTGMAGAQPPPGLEWAMTLGGDFNDAGTDIRVLSDTSIIVATIVGNSILDSVDTYVLWLNNTGDTIATRTYGGPRNDVVRSLCLRPDGSTILAGFTDSNVAMHQAIWLVAIDADTQLIWENTLELENNSAAYTVCSTADGGFAVAGYIASDPPALDEFLLSRHDAGGDTLWTRRYGRGLLTQEAAYGVISLEDGGFVVAGFTEYSPPIQYAMFVVRTNAFGDTVWTRVFGESTSARASAISQQPDGDLVLVGTCGPSFDTDAIIMCLSLNGDSLWSNTWGVPFHNEEFLDVVCDENGDVIVTGFSEQPLDLTLRCVLAKFDGFTGDTLWTTTFRTGSSPEWIGAAIDRIVNGGYVITGSASQPTFPWTDILVLKTGPELSVQIPPIIPDGFTLYQNYPNPFNSTTTFMLIMPRPSPVRLSVFNTLGQRVRDMSLGQLAAGEHRYLFDASGLPSGVYLARVEAAGKAETRKVVLLR